MIVYAWVNDTGSLRAYQSGDDAYRVFTRMLQGGHPPDSWDVLLAEATLKISRLQKLAAYETGWDPEHPERG